MRVQLGAVWQALRFPACVHRDPALHGGENRPGEVDSRGFPAEVWCLPLSLAVRCCFCIKASQNKMCVLRAEERKGSLLGKADSLDAVVPLC